MNNYTFFDTNILIYSYSKDEPDKKEKALSILKSKNLLLNTQVINEFNWIMMKKFNQNPTTLLEIVQNLFNRYKIISITEIIIFKALEICDRYKYSYWDSLIISSALDNNCEILYTEDLQHEQIIDNKLKIINPFLYTQLFRV